MSKILESVLRCGVYVSHWKRYNPKVVVCCNATCNPIDSEASEGLWMGQQMGFLHAANIQYVRGVLHDTTMERVPKTVNMKREIETVHKSL